MCPEFPPTFDFVSEGVAQRGRRSKNGTVSIHLQEGVIHCPDIVAMVLGGRFPLPM